MRGRLARNTLRGIFWQAIRVACQATWMIIVAHSLGANGLGVLAGTLGLATTLGGLSGFGGAMVLLKNASKNPGSFDRYWSQSLVLSLCGSTVLASAFLLFSPTEHGWALLLAIACADLLCAPFIVLCSHAFQARERMGWHSALPALSAFARLLAALAFWLLSTTHDIGAYAVLHAMAGFLSAGLAYLAVLLVLEPRPHPFTWSVSEAREGAAFSTLWVTGNATTELDKAVALYVGGGEIAGVYAAAYRFASVVALPVVSLIAAVQPRLFREPTNSRLLRHSVVAILGWSALGGIALQLFAPYIPKLFGDQFGDAAQLARWLGLWVPLYGMRMLGMSVLTSQGRLTLRIGIECAGLAFMLALGAGAIPHWGALGAAAMALGTEALLAALTWLAVTIHRR